MKAFVVIGIILVLLWGCSDAGSDPPTSATIQGVFPDSAAVGDTILITGSAFGTVQGTSVVTFGGATVTIVVAWSDTRLIVGVPSGAASGAVSVSVAGQSSNLLPFRVQPTTEARVSYSGQLVPLFTSNGCTGCHGGTNNLFVTPHANLMLGTSVHGPVVTPYDGEGSVIIRKLRGTAGFGNRMPQGGPFLTNANIELIARWIKQGARNN